MNVRKISLVATMVRQVERKALYIHSLYIVVIKGTKNLSTSYAVVTLHGGIGRLLALCGNWGIPSVVYNIVSREFIFRLPGNHSVNQSRVEYTSYARLPQPSPYPQSSDEHFTTTTTPVYNCNSQTIYLCRIIYLLDGF
jgi:hypothetical protein